MSKLRIVVAEFECEGDISPDFLSALREALGGGSSAEPSASKVTVSVAPDAIVPEAPAPVARRAESDDGQSGTIRSQILAAYFESPSATKAEIAKRVYGDSLPATIHRLGTHIHLLLEQGKIRRTGIGRYEVVP